VSVASSGTLVRFAVTHAAQEGHQDVNAAGPTTATSPDAPVAPARRGRHAARRLTSTDAAVLVLIAAQLGLRAWVSFSGWFYQDDFIFASDAIKNHLDTNYLLHGYNGHVTPGAWLWTWLQIRSFGMSYGASVGIQLVLLAVTSVAMWALLRMWFGPRRVLILPLAFYLFSPLTLGAYTWWASAINHQPMQLATIAAMYAHLRWIRTGANRYVVPATAAIGFGLLFFEKSVVIVPLLFGISLLVEREGSLLRDAVTILRRRAVGWVAYVGVCVAFYAVYFSHVDKIAAPERPSPLDVTDYALTAFGKAIVPSLFGGPWQWEQAGFLGLAEPSGGVKYVTWVLAAILVAESIRRVRGAGRVWLVVLGYLAVDLVLVVIGRLSYIGPGLGREFRYIADSSTIITFALALVAVAAADSLGSAAASRGQAVFRTVLPYVLGAFLLSCWVSTAAFTDIWRRNPSEQYFANLQGDIRAAQGRVSVHDQEVPNDVLIRLAFPRDLLSHVLLPFPDQPRYNDPNLPLKVADETGKLRPAVMQTAATAPTGPDPGCGYRVENGTVTVPLAQETWAWPWAWRIAYLTDQDFVARVLIGERSARVRFKPGLNAVWIRTDGAQDHVTIDDVPAGVPLCVTEVLVGTPVAAPPTG
jgi:hypothetical protein